MDNTTSELQAELSTFADALADRGVARNTVINYAGSLRRFAAHLAQQGNGYGPAVATAEDVAGYLATVAHRPASYATNEIKSLRAYYDTIGRADNPAAEIARPSLPTPIGTPWSAGEINQLLAATLNPRSRPQAMDGPTGIRDVVAIQLWVRFALTTGQLRRLVCADVDLAAGTLTYVPRTRPRVLALPRPIRGLLDDYLHTHRPRLAGETWLLPGGRLREQLPDDEFERLLARTAHSAGLAPPYTAARLRRSFPDTR